MTDRFGRTIDYMRVSVIDRCNLRCKYCVPDGFQPVEQGDVLSYEEILRICRVAVSMRIVKFKITGGEPLLRKDCALFISRLKALPGVEQVTLTTNGLLLAGYMDALCTAGIDGINISLDTLDEKEYCALTGSPGGAIGTVMRLLRQCVDRGLRVKINTVLLAETFKSAGGMALLARDMPLDVRFIEVMPVRGTETPQGVSIADALEHLRGLWPDLRPIDEKRGNGPAQYYAADGLRGRIGFIGAMSHQFCSACNRVRLTSAGALKPCLFHGRDADIRALLRSKCTDEDLRRVMQSCIEEKPQAYNPSEHVGMCRIGG